MASRRPIDWILRRPATTVSVGAGIVCSIVLVGSFCPEQPLSERAGFAAAINFVRAEAGPATFVLVWPPEQAAALGALPAGLKAADAVPLEAEDRRQYLEILVVGPNGFTTPPELVAATLRERKLFDAVEVGVFEYGTADRVVFDLRRDLAAAHVQLSGPNQPPLVCNQPRPEGGVACPGQPPWNHVAPTSLVVVGQDWPCVWAHPISHHQLLIELAARPLADRVALEAALADPAAATPGGAEVQIDLRVDGVGKRQLRRTNHRGIARVEMETPRGRRAGIRVTITTANDGRRHLGINLRLVETRSPNP